MYKVLKEPLLHFLLLGAAIFGVFKLTAQHDAGEPHSIVITQGRIDSLAMTFARTWQRPPSQAELEGLIRDYIKEEVYYREAMALGLDRDDTVIRRRLRQKLEFVSEDVAAQAAPTDDDLRAFLHTHPDLFRTERRFTFTQVYLNPEQHRDTLAVDAVHLLTELNQAGETAALSTLGDVSLLEPTFERVPAADIVQQFGAQFADTLSELPLGQWQGPITSGYGAHLVFINGRSEGRLPELDEVRDAVRRAWADARRLEVSEKLYQTLLQRYTVSIARPQPAEKQEKQAEG